MSNVNKESVVKAAAHFFLFRLIPVSYVEFSQKTTYWWFGILRLKNYFLWHAVVTCDVWEMCLWHDLSNWELYPYLKKKIFLKQIYLLGTGAPLFLFQGVETAFRFKGSIISPCALWKCSPKGCSLGRISLWPLTGFRWVWDSRRRKVGKVSLATFILEYIILIC